MVEIFTQKEIERISMDLLKQSKSIDIFPTPVDNIVRFAELVHDNGLDLSKPDPSFLSRMSASACAALMDSLNKVRGFLDRPGKTIYVDLNQIQPRQSFVKLHETGHQVLTWQSDIIEHLDDDDTLSADTKEEFEAEANFFASVTLFQHDRFDGEMEKLELSLKAGMALAKKFGSSNHAALRRMVEKSNKKCALLVLHTHSGIILHGMDCKKKSLFQSQSFTQEFGNLNIPEVLGYNWIFTQDYISGKKFHEGGEVILETSGGMENFKYHYFNNNYNAFFFIIPFGEVQKSRTKIVLRNYT